MMGNKTERLLVILHVWYFLTCLARDSGQFLALLTMKGVRNGVMSRL
jgi:hypothetical protein